MTDVSLCLVALKCNEQTFIRAALHVVMNNIKEFRA